MATQGDGTRIGGLEDEANYGVSYHQLEDSTTSTSETGEGDDATVRSLWTISSISIVLLGFIGGIEYSIVMPSLSAYVEKLGGSSLFYGCCVSIFSLTRVCSMPIVGYWSDKADMFQPLLFTISLSLLGNLFYASAECIGSPWFILFGRALVGIGASNGTLTISYITRCSTKENRTKALTSINAINISALVLGPVTNLITKDVFWNTPIPGVSLNEYTNPGWLMSMMLSILLVITCLTFEEAPRKPDDLSTQGIISLDDENQSTGISSPTLLLFKNPSDWSKKFKRLWVEHSIWIFFIFSWTNNFVLSELETALPALVRRHFGWEQLEISLLFCYLGACVITAFIAIHKMSHCISDRSFIGFGVVIYGVGILMCLLFLSGENVNKDIFIAIITILGMSISLFGSPNMALYSKVLEANGGSSYMGLFMSFIQQVNSVARLLAPIYGGFSLGFKTATALYIPPAILLSICGLLMLIKWDLLRVEKKEMLIDGAISSQ